MQLILSACYHWHLRCKSTLDIFVYVCFCLGTPNKNSRIFHSYGDVTITDEGLQILTYTWHSWPLSSEGSLACHTYCDTVHQGFFFLGGVPFWIFLIFHWALGTFFNSVYSCSSYQKTSLMKNNSNRNYFMLNLFWKFDWMWINMIQ